MNLSQIAPLLYVGSQPEARDYAMLRDLGIRLIISMRAARRPPAALNRAPIQVLWLPNIDTWFTPVPRRHLLQGVRAAEQVMQAGGAVFSHCHYGRHRSVLMAAAILIAQGQTAGEAMALLRAQRASARPQTWYVRRQIVDFERWWREDDRR